MSKKSMGQVFWFIGGLALGITLISLVHASQTPREVTELTPKRATLSQENDPDYTKLNQLESRYAESWAQQQKIREATSGKKVAKSKPLVPKKSVEE